MVTRSYKDELPAGTVTFLFTDIEGSTELLGKLGEAYTTLLADQRKILRECFTKWNGREVDTQGDAFFYSFPRATEAVSAAVEAQRAIASHSWPEGAEVRVRMGLHTGEPLEVSEGGYVGMDVHRAARIAHVGHGGQVLLSETTASLVLDKMPEGVSLVDLGRHLLKDIHRPEHIRQLVIENLSSEFPPLTSIETLSTQELREPRTVGACPYQGLSAFNEENAEFFFGREEFTDRLMEAIRSQPMVAVIIGSSGSGKSSSVFAGLLPRLRAQGKWQIGILRPGPTPFYALAGSLLPMLEPDLSETERLAETRKLAEQLKGNEITLHQVMVRVLEKNASSERLLLVIDQFEELFTLCPDVTLQHSFIDELLALVETIRTSRVASHVVLLTLRADFMSQALAHRPFADALHHASLPMGPMTRDELRSVIEKPAEVQGAAFEAGLVERILEDVGQEPGNLPLLEFALTLLWEAQSDGWLTHTDYEAIGCVDGALARYADEVLEDLSESDQEQARRVFVQLIKPGEGTEDTRRVATRSELTAEDWELVQHLADRRLVVTGRDDDGNEVVEVVHEALIQHWSELQIWIEEDRTFRVWQERLRAAMREWERNERDEGALLRGAPLAQAEEWHDERGGDLSTPEREFIQASAAFRDERQKVRERRRQRTLIGLAVGLVIALVLVVIAGQQWLRAEDAGEVAVAERGTAQVASTLAIEGQGTAQAASTLAIKGQQTAQANANALATARAVAENKVTIETARDLADAATQNLDEDPQLSLLLALHSMDMTREIDGSVLSEARSVLYHAVQASSRLVQAFSGEDPHLLHVAYSPDGERLVTYGRVNRQESRYSHDSHTRVWDSMTGEFLYSLEGHIAADFWLDRKGLATFDRIDPSVLEISFWDELGRDTTSTSRVGLPVEADLEARLSDFQSVVENIFVEYLTTNSEGTRAAVTIVSQDGYGQTTIWDLESSEMIFSQRSGLLHFEAGLARDTRKILTELPSAFSPSGTYLATGGTDGIARIWNVNTGEELFTLVHGDEDDVVAIAFSPDGTLLATGGGAYAYVGEPSYSTSEPIVIRIWDVATGQIVARLMGHSEFVNDLSFSLDGSLLATTSYDQSIKIWDVESSIATGTGQALTTLADLPEAPYAIAFSPDGRYLAGVGFDGMVRVWEIALGGVEGLRTYSHEPAPDPASQVTIALSPDGGRVVVADASQSPSVWNTETGELLFQLIGHTDRVEQVEYSSDGTMIATGSYDGTIKIWDAVDGKLSLILEGYKDGCCDLAFHPTDRRIAVISIEGWIYAFDLPDPSEVPMGDPDTMSITKDGLFVAAVSGVGARDIEYSPGGELIAGSSSSYDQVKFWEAGTGEGTQFLISLGFSDITSDFNVDSFTFSPAGDRIITNSRGGPIALWNIEDGELIRTFGDPLESALCAALSPDGRRLASGSSDGTATVWEVETGLELFTFAGHTDAVTDAAFSKDGKRLYTASLDGTVREYLLDIEELMDVARSQLTRTLTTAECQEYLHMDECPPLP